MVISSSSLSGMKGSFMNHIQLFAPNELPIVGALAQDDTLREFDYSYSRNTQVRLYVLKDGRALGPEPTLLVDSAGNRWNSSEVEWYTLFRRDYPHRPVVSRLRA
jgi:hypothetical protein